MAGVGAMFQGELVAYGGLFLGAQPVGMFRSVGQPEPAEQPERHRRQAGHDEQHLPVLQAEHTMQVGHDVAGQWSGDHPGDGRRHQECRSDAPAQCAGEPVGEIEDHAGEEAGFGDAEQEAGGDQLIRRGDEGGPHGDQAPQHHDAGQRGAGAGALHVQVAGDLEEDVGQIEGAHADAVGGVGQGDVLGHAQLGEGNVQPVDGVDGEGDDEERHQPPDHLGVGRLHRLGGLRCRGRWRQVLLGCFAHAITPAGVRQVVFIVSQAVWATWIAACSGIHAAHWPEFRSALRRG
ncbi:hypothetical protein D3C80_1319850 [compost metagenome]